MTQKPWEKFPECREGKVKTQRRSWWQDSGLVTYLTPLLLPEDGRRGISFGLTLEDHVITRSCHLVLRLGYQLGWDWEEEEEKGTRTQENQERRVRVQEREAHA